MMKWFKRLLKGYGFTPLCGIRNNIGI